MSRQGERSWVTAEQLLYVDAKSPGGFDLDPEGEPEPPIPRGGNEGRESVGAPEVSESQNPTSEASDASARCA